MAHLLDRIYDFADQYANKNDDFTSKQIKENMELFLTDARKEKWDDAQKVLIRMLDRFAGNDNHMVVTLNDLFDIFSSPDKEEAPRRAELIKWDRISHGPSSGLKGLTKVWTELKTQMPDQKYFIFDEYSQTVYITNECLVHPPQTSQLLINFMIVCGLLNRFRLANIGQYPQSAKSIPFNISFWLSEDFILKKDLHVLYTGLSLFFFCS